MWKWSLVSNDRHPRLGIIPPEPTATNAWHAIRDEKAQKTLSTAPSFLCDVWSNFLCTEKSEEGKAHPVGTNYHHCVILDVIRRGSILDVIPPLQYRCRYWQNNCVKVHLWSVATADNGLFFVCLFVFFVVFFSFWGFCSVPRFFIYRAGNHKRLNVIASSALNSFY